MATQTHFTAVIEVNKVDLIEPPTTNTRHLDSPPPTGRREVSEVTKLVLRADTLTKLIDKMNNHITLLDD